MKIGIDSYSYHRYFGEVYEGLESAGGHPRRFRSRVGRRGTGDLRCSGTGILRYKLTVELLCDLKKIRR